MSAADQRRRDRGWRDDAGDEADVTELGTRAAIGLALEEDGDERTLVPTWEEEGAEAGATWALADEGDNLAAFHDASSRDQAAWLAGDLAE